MYLALLLLRIHEINKIPMFSKDWIKPMKTKIDTFVKAHKLNCSTRSDSKAVCDCGFEEVLAENETIKEFIAKVSKMRTAQANWFRALAR